MGMGLGLRKKLEKRLRPFKPRGYRLAPPVAQLYVADAGRSTRFTFIDFPSFLSPRASNEYYYEVAAFRADGSSAGLHRIEVGSLQAREIGVEELGFSSLGNYGIVTAQIKPKRLLSYRDRHLGELTSHFYALFHSRNWQSVALVHPQTTVQVKSQPMMQWTSLRLLDFSKLVKIEVFQINPTPAAFESRLLLRSLKGAIHAVSEGVIAPFGTRQVVWDASCAPTNSLLTLSADGMTCPNGKPLVFYHFLNESFSAAHS